jgi:hypothetical protein
MIRGLFSLIKSVVVILVIVVALLLAPVGYTEFACRGTPLPSANPNALITDPAHKRVESATYLTYPEWHVVNAYDEYAKVLESGDPHHYDYISSVFGFWTSLCSLNQVADGHGGGDLGTKLMVYTVGASFTFEFAMKAAYEETVGRIVTLIRGPYRDNLDEISAAMARDYAGFLHQVPWYQYDFGADREILRDRSQKSIRDVERRMALGVEFGVKSAYAKLIAKGVEATGKADLTIRSVVTGLTDEELTAIDGVTIIGKSDQGTEIETPRYRAFTNIVIAISEQGGTVLDIAGNDDVLVSALSDNKRSRAAVASFTHQGYGDYRHLLRFKVNQLSDFIRSSPSKEEQLEHIFDY